MLKCWSHLPKDRPTFTELSDKLWDLEHKEEPYVNLDSLMQQSIESELGMQNYFICTITFLRNSNADVVCIFTASLSGFPVRQIILVRQ
jgi:hypothetical protein